MMSLPYCAISRLLPERKPSPRPTSSSKDPTPHAMPNMVRNERSLCAQRVRKICVKMSRTMRIRSIYLLLRINGRMGSGFVSGHEEHRQDSLPAESDQPDFARVVGIM